ncbi:MAG: hypothetical protein K0U08_00670 [Proteobacteria bacterium]|nr:hypothetical protein [Pseudomonadota bacterium]MCH9712358.1 hypothetical protein [Pseudomonadota bacterium]
MSEQYNWPSSMLYHPTGDPINIKPIDNNEFFGTDELETFIGGPIGHIKLDNGMLVINDKGKEMNLPINEMASKNGYSLYGNLIFVPKIIQAEAVKFDIKNL